VVITDLTSPRTSDESLNPNPTLSLDRARIFLPPLSRGGPRRGFSFFMNQTKAKKPVLTVYMPVFNAASYLPESIESILSQTYSNFEFIIIDDASTDRSWSIIQKYTKSDKRIRAYRNSINLGVSLTSNIAISKAKGKFLARMDADDISQNDRFTKQIKFLRQHKKVIAVGGQCIVIDDTNHIIGYKNFPTQPSKLKEMIFWAIPIQQPSMMVNLALLPKGFTWYNRSKTSAEEVDLMFRFLKFGQIANLKNYYLFYRHLAGSLSHIDPKRTFYLTLQSRLAAVNNGYRPSIKGYLLNLAQVIVVSLLPSQFINGIWYILRGISQPKTPYKIGSLATTEVIFN
jgi:glycosyltransferase involved in cell wall biosynthesis